MWFKTYQALTCLGTPAIRGYLSYRSMQGKEDRTRIGERYGRASFPRPQGTLLWIHAASVGESVSMLPVIRELLERDPDLRILVTTITVTSATMMESRLPERAYHQYVPVDSYSAVKRFLAHWKPDMAMFVESELWPNLIIQTSQLGIPMMLVNGRVSDHSLKFWQKTKSLSQHMLGSFRKVLAQSEEDARRYRELGASDVAYIGNLKFDAAPLPADSKETGRLIQMIGDRHIWLLASSHPGEEKLAAKIHTQLSEAYPDLLTIIAPRHPGRMEEIIANISSEKCNVAVRSQGDVIHEDTDIYLADTMGELGLFYRLSPIVLIGGSMVSHGGQNPLEPARLNCAIICGPHMHNFAEVMHAFTQDNACLQAMDEPSLQHALNELLGQPERVEELAAKAAKLVDERKGVLERVIEHITHYLPIAADRDDAST